jgi:hypothetical protein
MAGTLEGFLDNMSNISAPPAFRSTYRDFFNHILLKFLEGLTESAAGLILDASKATMMLLALVNRDLTRAYVPSYQQE